MKVAKVVTQALAAQVAVQGRGVAPSGSGLPPLSGDYPDALVGRGDAPGDRPAVASPRDGAPQPVPPGTARTPTNAKKASKATRRQLRESLSPASAPSGSIPPARKSADSPRPAAAPAPLPAPLAAETASLRAKIDLVGRSSTAAEIDPTAWVQATTAFASPLLSTAASTQIVNKSGLSQLVGKSGDTAASMLISGAQLVAELPNRADSRLSGRIARTTLARLQSYSGSVSAGAAAQQPETGPFPPGVAKFLLAGGKSGTTPYEDPAACANFGVEYLAMTAQDKSDVQRTLDLQYPATNATVVGEGRNTTGTRVGPSIGDILGKSGRQP